MGWGGRGGGHVFCLMIVLQACVLYVRSLYLQYLMFMGLLI